MNRLGFADFHNKHFSHEQKLYWQNMLQQQQQQQQYYDYSQTTYNEHWQEQHTEEEWNDDRYHEVVEEEEEEVEENFGGLTKEAIAIFKFSEAYRKEREVERLREEHIDKEGMEDWQFDESTVHVSGGQEAPATSLVLTKKSNKPNLSEKLRIQEELLNSAYLASCSNKDNQNVPVILWPVLPFKM